MEQHFRRFDVQTVIDPFGAAEASTSPWSSFRIVERWYWASFKKGSGSMSGTQTAGPLLKQGLAA